MYANRDTPFLAQPMSNVQYHAGQYHQYAPEVTLRHSSASPLSTYGHDAAHAPMANVSERQFSRIDVADKPTLPSFREAFPEHCIEVSGPQHRLPHWDGPKTHMMRSSPSSSLGHSHGYDSQYSSPRGSIRSLSPEAAYVYAPQPRSNSPLPPLLEPMAALAVSNRTQIPPMHQPRYPVASSLLALHAPRAASGPQTILQPTSDNTRGKKTRQHSQEKRRPVLRPVQRLPASSKSDWEQFVRETEDENGDWSLQCIWEVDDGHSCLYQAEKQAMKRHVEVTHMGIKQHQCEFCGNRFGQKTAMDVHRATHTGATPWECKYKCGRSFSDPARRFRHHKQDHDYVPKKRQNKNRKRAKLAKAARAAAAAASTAGSPDI